MHIEDQFWKSYIADGLKYLTFNTAGQGERQWLTERYSDLITGKEPEKEEDAQSIISRIRADVEGE